MARKSTNTMRPEVNSREAKIGMLVASGLSNAAIWAAMEQAYPQTIQDADQRKQIAGQEIPYDELERERLGWAIRSVKATLIKEDDEFREIVAEDDSMKNADKTEFKNRPRFSTGIPGLDKIYGKTYYKYEADDSPHKAGELTGIIEAGMPKSYMSIWGGAPGVGKTRLAMQLGKSLNNLGKMVLYFNGEADEGDFRYWLGTDVNGELFKVYTPKNCIMYTDTICKNAYQYRAPVIIIDSVQMLVEWNKGQRGQIGALVRLKLLKSEVEAGLPHIVLISQLNKQNTLSGSRKLEHLAAASIGIRRHFDLDGKIVVESNKMRGAPAPIDTTFKHTNDGIIWVPDDGLAAVTVNPAV